MKTKKYWIWVIVSFSILVVVWAAQQITGETGQSAKDKETDGLLADFHKAALSGGVVVKDDKELLQGLEGVRVAVEFIKPESEKYGLTRKALQTDTELQLRQYGIKVLTEEEWLSTPGMPILYINVNVSIPEESPVVAAGTAVELLENVLLLREPKRVYHGATTWRRKHTLSVGLLRIKDIRESVKDSVSEFINDYLAANPKDGSIKTKGSLLDDFKPKDGSIKEKGSVFDDFKPKDK